MLFRTFDFIINRQDIPDRLSPVISYAGHINYRHVGVTPQGVVSFKNMQSRVWRRDTLDELLIESERDFLDLVLRDHPARTKIRIQVSASPTSTRRRGDIDYAFEKITGSLRECFSM
jgi:hypothetical protein